MDTLDGLWASARGFLDHRLFDLGDSAVTPGRLFTALALVLGASALSKLFQRTARLALTRRGMDQRGLVPTVQRLTHYAIMLVGVALALDAVGISVGTLFAAGAVVAVGVGFAMQNIAQNFVSGVILLVERAIKAGTC